MVDCNSELNKFYNEKVRLGNLWNTLGKYRDINLDRLKNGLRNNNSPAYNDTISQGSYSMRTIVQHVNNDYDIDVGVVFDNSKIGNMTSKDIKDMVYRAIQDDRFQKAPEVLKNCVRVYYSEGHHVDMAIYRKKDDKQELASSDWEESNPKEIVEWFDNAVISKSPDDSNGRQLRRIVRFLKFWSISRKTWDIPSGLILTILAVECYAPIKARDDQAFYDTLKKIKNRLQYNKSILNPLNSKEIVNSDKHKRRVENLYNELQALFDEYLSELELTKDKKKVLMIWGKFFNSDFFDEYIKNLSCSAIISTPNKPWLI